MAAIEFESQHTNPWEIPELTQDDYRGLTETLFLETTPPSDTTNATTETRSSVGGLQHGAAAAEERNVRDECFRAPLLLAYALRQEILSQRSGAYLADEFSHVNEELKLLDCVTDFVRGFHGLKKLVETPFPFPLIQMTRTFLFVWVFTLPLVLCHEEHKNPFDPLLMIFLTTFGFIGVCLYYTVWMEGRHERFGLLTPSFPVSPFFLKIGIEFVCMELDDPFGDDPNDFDDLGMAQLVFEDIYISIYKLDGNQAASQLRRKIVARIKRGTALENFQDDYQHGYTPTKEDTIAYDRRLDFQKESPFYHKSATPKKKKSRVAMPTVKMPSFTKRKKNKKERNI